MPYERLSPSLARLSCDVCGQLQYLRAWDQLARMVERGWRYEALSRIYVLCPQDAKELGL